jgi:membrane protease YdiL (CAAX protease family)
MGRVIRRTNSHFFLFRKNRLAGIATIALYQYVRNKSSNYFSQPNNATTTTTTVIGDNNANRQSLPKLLSTPRDQDMPWKNIWKSKYSPITSFVALLLLIKAYLWIGILSLWWEETFYELAVHFPITVPMHRSLCVLMGHASWILLGGLILRFIPRPQPFFQQPRSNWFNSDYGSTQWLWWTMGGYFVSSWLFNIADLMNSYLLPLSILEQAEESSIVSQLVNPEGQDWLASLVGYLAPCINAPWWEEVLYRGFLLPTLVLLLPYKWAVGVSGVLFSLHHSSIPAFLPLCVLGWTWAIVYTKSKNLWTTIVIHAMWNSRIFIGSWFGV